MYTCDYFAIHELVPPSVYADRGEKAWQLLDERMLKTLDNLRDRFGSITCNNYHWGGDRAWSGLRTPDSPWFSPYSQHTFGRAADLLFNDEGVTTDEVRNEILANPHHIDFTHIGSMELDTSWLHFDVRNCDRIKTFNGPITP